jgi:hypothetical protein
MVIIRANMFNNIILQFADTEQLCVRYGITMYCDGFPTQQ